MKSTIFLHPFFLRVNQTHLESIGSFSDIGEINEIDGNFRFSSVFPVLPISECDPIDSEWVLLAREKNCCRNNVGFMTKKPTSGFQVPTGSGKVARVELYTPPKFHPNRFTGLGGDSFAQIKNVSKQN